MKRNVFVFVLLGFCFCISAETASTFGKCQALDKASTASLVSEIYKDGNMELISKLFGLISDVYNENNNIQVVFFKIVEKGTIGYNQTSENTDEYYLVMFPPITKWRFFSPDGITYRKITEEKYTIQNLNDCSGWVVVFSKDKNSHYKLIEVNNAN